MKLTLQQYGGWAAPLRLGRGQAALSVDLAALPAGEAARLRELVARARAAAPPQGAPRPSPDAMTYVLTIEGEGESATLRASDTSMGAEFADLLDQLQTLRPAP